MLNRVEELNITDFAGGLLTGGNPYTAKKNTTPNCLNVYADIFGNLARRDGITKFNSTALGGGTGYGLFDYEVTSGIRKIVVVIDDTIYKIDHWDGIYDSLRTGLTAERWGFTNFDNYLIMVSATNEAQVWDGSNSATTPLSAMPSGTTQVISWKQRVWALGGDDHDISYSETSDHTSWPTENTWGIYSYAGDSNQAFGLLRDFLFVFKKYSIFKVTYLGGSPLLDVQDVGAPTGTMSPDSVQQITWQGKKGLMFYGTDGKVYFFDGYSPPISVSDHVEEDNGETTWCMDFVNKNDLGIIHSINWTEKNWYVLFAPKKPSSTCNYAIVFDYSKAPMAVWPWDNYNASASAMAKFGNTNRAIFVDYSGDMHRMEYGNNDNGTPITSYWYSVHSVRGSIVKVKGSRFVRISLKNVGDFGLSFKYRTDWGLSWKDETFTMLGGGDTLGVDFVLGTSVLGGDRAVDKDLSLPIQSNHVQFGIYSAANQPKYEIYSMVELYKTQGAGIA